MNSSALASGSDVRAETHPSPVLKLTDRLRGIYTIPVNDGAGLLNGKDTITREFETPPIQKEAADVIDALVEALEQCAEALAFARDKLGYVGEGDHKDRKGDGSDPTGSFHALTAARNAINKATGSK